MLQISFLITNVTHKCSDFTVLASSKKKNWNIKSVVLESKARFVSVECRSSSWFGILSLLHSLTKNAILWKL